MQIRPVKLVVVKTDSIDGMQKQIDALLVEGYLFHGDFKVMSDMNGTFHYIQAMVKAEAVSVQMIPQQQPRGSIVAP
ncbi:MAG: hypothetical protein JZU63_10250 [Rhodoferax sp.]|nr:hypothetical protein [Rhodoferax sp.]